MTPPRPAALCLDPHPRLRVGPGAPRPHSPRRTAGLGNRLERASERARRRARVGGAASKPRSRESERRGGGGAAGGRALLPPAPLALWPPGGGYPASSELRRREQGPRVALQALRALDLTRGRLGSPRVVRAGAWEEEDEEEDGLPGAPPAPAASHLPSAPPSPQLRPMGSFIPSSALYKYLPSAHRVPTAELCAGGGRGGCGGRNPSRPHPPGTPSPDGRGGLSRTRGIWPRRRKLGEFEGCAEIRGGFPKRRPPAPLVAPPLPFTPATATPPRLCSLSPACLRTCPSLHPELSPLA